MIGLGGAYARPGEAGRVPSGRRGGVWLIVYYVDERDFERCKRETGVVDSLQSRF